MSSGRGFSSYHRGGDRDHGDRRDSRDSSHSRNLPIIPSRGWGTKCRNFDPDTRQRLRACKPGCVFAHPGESAWDTARATRPMGPPPPPNRDRDRERDRERERDRDRGRNSRDSGPHERSNSWGTASERRGSGDHTATTGSSWSTPGSGWGTAATSVLSRGADSFDGWGPRAEATSVPIVEDPIPSPVVAINDGWGQPGSTSVRDSGTPASKEPPPNRGPDSSARRLSDRQPGSTPAPSRPTVSVDVNNNVPDTNKGWASTTPIIISPETDMNVDHPANTTPTVSTPVSSAPHTGQNWGGTTEKRADPRVLRRASFSKDLPEKPQWDPGLPPKPSRVPHNPADNPNLPRKPSQDLGDKPRVPDVNLNRLPAQQHAPISPQDVEFSFNSSRRPSTDNVTTGGASHNAPASLPLNTIVNTQRLPMEGSGTAASSSIPPEPSSSNSLTPKPTLKLTLSFPEKEKSQPLSLLLQSPMASSAGGDQNPGSTSSEPLMQLWSNNVEVLSRAVAARTERLQLSEASDSRQRLISRISKKAGRPSRITVPNSAQENEVKVADQNVEATLSALVGNGEHWWPTPRQGIDHTKVISALETDIESLQQQLGAWRTGNDEMEIDTQDPAEIKRLHDKRKDTYLEVQSVLEDMTENLATGATEEFVVLQNVKLQEHVSRILEQDYPPVNTHGDERLVKAEALRERLANLETRITNYRSDLRRRNTLGVQREADVKSLKARYEALRTKQQDVARRKKKLTEDARGFLAEMQTRPILADQVLERTINAAAQEKMARLMVPKLLAITEEYRTEDLAWAAERQATVSSIFNAWKVTRERERKQRSEAFLQELRNHQTIKAVDIAGEKIEQRWDEIISVQVSRKPPAIRIPEASGSRMG